MLSNPAEFDDSSSLGSSLQIIENDKQDSDGTNDIVNIVGAGLTGGMLALLMAKRGMSVRVIEARPDFRVAAVNENDEEKDSAFGQLTNSSTRSINLALSYRGICALKEVGLFEAVEQSLVPMHGRYMHDKGGRVSFQPYGVDGECIYSVSRLGLNKMLLDEIERCENCEVIFDTKVQRVKRDGTVVAEHPDQYEIHYQGRFTAGADGAFSVVRESILRLSRCNLSQSYIEHGYKELSIPATKDGEFALENPYGLHIWPRHEFMLIALPNPDKSFTVTLFAPFGTLEAPETSQDVLDFMQGNFPDAVRLMPDIETEWFQNPSSALITVRLSQWIYDDKIVLLGDAAHAVVPFYGQGMNAGFEDCLVFDEIWEELGGDPAKVLKRFAEVRQPIGSAISKLSMDNYIEMRSHTAKSTFLLRKAIERQIHKLAPNSFIPLYSMVAFTRIPYDEIEERVKRQDRWFNVGALAVAAAAAAGAYKLATFLGWKAPQLL